MEGAGLGAGAVQYSRPSDTSGKKVKQKKLELFSSNKNEGNAASLLDNISLAVLHLITSMVLNLPTATAL